MAYKICEWDSELGKQIERDSTPAEDAQRTADLAASSAPVVPQAIPMLNAHLVLVQAGWMPAVRSYIDAIPGIDGDQARVYFDMALIMHRDHPLVQSIPAAIGKTDAEVDALFIAAEALNA